MTIRVRAVDLDSEQDQLLAVLERNLPDLDHTRRFKWLYRDNPLGPAWSWLAWETGRREAIGVASVFRRAMWVGGRVEACGQVGDFAIDASHRSLGPALMLQRATFEPVETGHLAFCYDCPPHERGMSTFRRLGITANPSMVRYARLLRADQQIAKWLGDPGASAISPFVNLLLRLPLLWHRPLAGLEIAVHEQRFDDDFSVLDRRVEGEGVVRGRRTADDLNWRFRDDPLSQYWVLTARRHGELVGFAVLARSGANVVYLVDLFGAMSPREAEGLLDAAVRHARMMGGGTVQALISSDNPLFVSLQRCGFRLRSRGPFVVAYVRPGSPTRTLLERGETWRLIHSDVAA